MAGRLRHYSLTLDATVQQLSDVLAEALRADQLDVNVSCDWIDLQADHGNGSGIVGGGSASLSTSNYGFRLPPASGGNADPPYNVKGAAKLSDIYVLGANNEVLHVFLMVQ